MNILVTGAAGFIGYTLCQRLIQEGADVVGLDNMNNYYDVRLKEARLALLKSKPNFCFVRADISSRDEIAATFSKHRFNAVVHLAAQAGVRYSIENPHAYGDANLVGFLNVLDACRQSNIGHLVYASSSSVYGSNAKLPFSENDNVDHPISLYAATKKANELMAHSYAHLYGLPCTGLRFFTAYGPWGRPDMALFKFTRGILADEAIPVFNKGQMVRDFTYIDDIVEGMMRVIELPAKPNPRFNPRAPISSSSQAPYRVYNIGNNKPVSLMRYIEVLESCLGKKAKLVLLPIQPGDVPSTVADVSALQEAVGFRPTTAIEMGISRFVDWYRSYYRV